MVLTQLFSYPCKGYEKRLLLKQSFQVKNIQAVIVRNTNSRAAIRRTVQGPVNRTLFRYASRVFAEYLFCRHPSTVSKIAQIVASGTSWSILMQHTPVIAGLQTRPEQAG